MTDGEHGLLVEPGNDADLARAVLALLRDPALRARLADAGRRRVESEFGVEQLIGRTLDAYRRFLGRQ